jgi:hypothetical protein
MPVARYAFAVCAIGGDIYVFGGCADDFQDQASVFKFDTLANEWTTLAHMPYTCSFHSVSVLDGLVYIVGIDQGGREALRFDPASCVAHARPFTEQQKVQCFLCAGRMHVCGGWERG